MWGEGGCPEGDSRLCVPVTWAKEELIKTGFDIAFEEVDKGRITLIAGKRS